MLRIVTLGQLGSPEKSRAITFCFPHESFTPKVFANSSRALSFGYPGDQVDATLVLTMVASRLESKLQFPKVTFLARLSNLVNRQGKTWD